MEICWLLVAHLYNTCVEGWKRETSRKITMNFCGNLFKQKV